jgi:tetratricopeptide (TPR) repeat protein
MAARKPTKPKRPSRPRIAVNGHFLDEVRTRLQSDITPDSISISYLSLPEELHRLVADGDAVVLRIPAITALQLYYDGVLPQDQTRPVTLQAGDQALGTFRLASLRKPAEYYEHYEHVLLRFERVQAPVSAGRRLSQSRSSPPGQSPRAVTLPPDFEPLKLNPHGLWDPEDEYWGEEGEPIEDWAKPIIARGPRPRFEMQQVLPGEDPEDFDSDPILEANELRARGETAQARRLLSELIEQDPRCLDAYAHLGSMDFHRSPKKALTHYQRGVEIGRLSLGEGFDGVLPWGMIDNRPFLRCLHGYGLCLWRLGRFEEAERVFDELLWLSPSDNLGVRFLLPSVRDRRKWTPDA